jgi:hypothetical protein
MPWFITKVDPQLVVPCGEGRVVRFRDAECRTADKVEVAALRAHPDVIEVPPEPDETPLIRRYAVNLVTKRLHDLTRRRLHCYISDELLAAARSEDDPPDNWKLYRRLSDATRWNPGAEECAYCQALGEDV